MNDTNNSVLTEANAIIARHFADDPANAVRAQQCVTEVLAKLPGMPADEWVHELERRIEDYVDAVAPDAPTHHAALGRVMEHARARIQAAASEAGAVPAYYAAMQGNALYGLFDSEAAAQACIDKGSPSVTWSIKPLYDAPPSAPAAEPVIGLTGAQLLEALDFVAPDRDEDQMESLACIQYGDGHSGKGVYCWLDDCKEEGAILLDGTTAAPAAESAEPESVPGWRPIETMDPSDDLIWLQNESEIEGPRKGSHLDIDRFTHWAPCEPPTAATPDAQTCGGCNGSGESTALSGGGPDAYDVPILCSKCSGTGATADAQGDEPPGLANAGMGEFLAKVDAHKDGAWRNLFWALARELNCLPSTFLDGNAHVFKAARAALSRQPSAPASAGDDPTERFMHDVAAELRRARAKFPGDRIMTIALAEEFGELAKAMLDESGVNVWKEAVQTAVMAARVAIDGDSSVDEWRAAKGLDNHRCAALAAAKPEGVSQ